MRYKALPASVRSSVPASSPARPPGPRDPRRDWLATLVMLVIVPLLAVPLVVTSAASPTLRVHGKPVAGAIITVDGNRMPRDEAIELLWDGGQTGVTGTTGRNGRFRAELTIPAAAAPGAHVLAAVPGTENAARAAGEVIASATVVVRPADEPVASPAPIGSDPPAGATGPTPLPSGTPQAPSTPTPTQTPTQAPTQAPTAAPTPAPTAAPTPAPTAQPTPTPAPTATPTPAPTSTPAPPAVGDFLVISRSAVLALPTSGPAWTALKSVADSTWSTPSLADQNNKADVQALAGALVYARTGSASYRARVVAALEAMWKGPWATDMLALARQTGGWVMAADLVGYRDPGFLSWLAAARTRVVDDHSRWTTLHFTAGNSSNNYGTFALTAMIAIDRFLGDSESLSRDWAIFRGYGDASWAFQPTAAYQAAWNCGRYQAIESLHCTTPGGVDQDGAPVEDASRGSYPLPHGGYVNEAMQGYAVQALLLRRAGYDAWGVNDRQILRVAEFQRRFGIWNYHSVGYHVAWIINHAYGVSFPTQPAGYGRTFGFTDWLFG